MPNGFNSSSASNFIVGLGFTVKFFELNNSQSSFIVRRGISGGEEEEGEDESDTSTSLLDQILLCRNTGVKF